MPQVPNTAKPAIGTTDAASRTVHAPRGTEISCKGWQQEAAMRMLMNNLGREVAEKTDGDIGQVGQRPSFSRRHRGYAADAYCMSPIRLG